MPALPPSLPEDLLKVSSDSHSSISGQHLEHEGCAEDDGPGYCQGEGVAADNCAEVVTSRMMYNPEEGIGDITDYEGSRDDHQDKGYGMEPFRYQ